MRFCSILLAALFLSSCSMLRRKKTDETGAGERSPGGLSVPIGQIVYVNDSADFVLVKSGSVLRLKEGAELESRQGMTPTAILDYSPERKRGFMTADILQGQPQIGDRVFVRQKDLSEAETRREAMRQRAEAIEKIQRNAGKERARKRMRKR